MRIEFVGHSSVVFRQDAVHMICDPWLIGTAFDDGWAMLSEPRFRPEDFAGITHIWYSHEHPDHFSPRSLAMIPEEFRRRIVVLFHASADRKIAQHCAKLGFAAVQELDSDHWVELAPGFDVLCNTWENTDDSWLLIRTPEGRILNLNDCQAATQAQIDSLHAQTGNVDVLLSQFSISAWDGNREELDRRQAGAEEMIRRTVAQARALGASHVIPFASYIWFCHEENDYMNECVTSPRIVSQRLRAEAGAQPVVLYPGDVWKLNSPMDPESAIARYEADIASIPSRPRHQAKPVDIAALVEAADRFSARLTADHSAFRLRIREVLQNARHTLRRSRLSPIRARLAALLKIVALQRRPARIWLADHAQCVTYSPLNGLKSASHQPSDCDIELSSAALLYALKFLWGGETLQVNGRFRENYPDGRFTLFDHLWISSAMNHEEGAAAKPI